MKKKVVASVLVAAMATGLLAGCGNSGTASGSLTDTVSNEYEEKVINGITYHVATDLTDENITLTYFNFDQDETTQYLAERFMELYPNIEVKVVYEAVGTYQDTLVTMFSNNEAPDVIMYSDADTALSNMWLADISSYYNSDEETAELASTINDCELGCYGTSARFGVPVKYFPSAVYVDRNVLTKLNLEIPSQNWTWDEMIQLIKDATTDIGDGLSYYGLGYYNRLDSYYGIASSQSIKGEFGFDGTLFDLSAWAVGEQQFSDLKLGGYVAPSQNSKAMLQWYGDQTAWCGSTGHVAMFSEAFWTFQNLWNTEDYEQYNLDIVPYVIPAVSEEDASTDHHTIATIDWGGVTTSCQYPREAYELLKFMSFGRDGWLTRIEMYNDETIVNASGVALKHDVMPAPITTNEEVWDAYIEMYCKGMDEEHVQLWTDYFASCMQPIPYGWTSIAGYWNYCSGYFNAIGIHDLVDAGKAKAADYVDEATAEANIYHAQAMINYFGPNGYDILTDEEIEYWESVEANGK